MKKLFYLIISLLLCFVCMWFQSCAVGAAVGKNVTAHVTQNDSVSTIVNLNQK